MQNSLHIAEDGRYILSHDTESERYVFIYTQQTARECLCLVGDYMENPDLAFNERDYAYVAAKIRRQGMKDEVLSQELRMRESRLVQ